MAIAFRDAGERRRKNITAVFMGSGNVGKTSLALTAEKPVLFDFDGNLTNADKQVRRGKDSVEVVEWADVAGLEPADLAGYKTGVIDTGGVAVEKLLAKILEDPKLRTRTGGPDWRQVGPILSRDFSLWLDIFRRAGLDIILTVHPVEEQRGEDHVERMDITGKSKNLILRVAQIMGTVYVDRDNKRIIDFNPKFGTVRKNVGIEPVHFLHPLEAPDTAARILAEAKIRINEDIGRNADEAQRLTDRQIWVNGMDTADQINSATTAMREGDAPAAEKRMLAQRARDIGLTYYEDIASWAADDAAAAAERKRQQQAKEAAQEAAQAAAQPAPAPDTQEAPAEAVQAQEQPNNGATVRLRSPAPVLSPGEDDMAPPAQQEADPNLEIF